MKKLIASLLLVCTLGTALPAFAGYAMMPEKMKAVEEAFRKKCAVEKLTPDEEEIIRETQLEKRELSPQFYQQLEELK